MAVDFPGWLNLPEAARRYGVDYDLLRNLVLAGVFTRGRFGAAKERPPIYLRIEELDAWKKGGVPAVEPVKAAFETTSRELAALNQDNSGGEG